MADNKKPKQDYREALAAQAEKVAPKDKRKETLTYDVGGEIVTIVRGDMSDESWEKVKAQVAPKEQTLKSKSLDWPTLMSLGQNLDGVADSVVSKEDKKLVARMPEWDRAEFLRQRFRTKGYDVPPNSADDEKASLKKQSEAEPAKPAAKPSGPTPDEWTPYPTEPTKPKSQGTQTEDVGSADPGMSPRGQMMRMAMGATPSLEQTNEKINQTSSEAMAALPSNPQKVPIDALRSLVREEYGKSATPSNPALVQGAEKQLATKFYGQDGSPVDPGEPPQPSFLDQVNDTATGVRQAITDVVTNPAGTIPPMMQRLATGASQMIDQGGPFGSAPPPPAVSPEGAVMPPPMEAQPPAPMPAPQQGGSVSVSGKIPGKGTAPAPVVDPRLAEIDRMAKEEQALIAAQAGSESEKIAKAAELQRQARDQRDLLQADEVKRQAAYEQTMQKYAQGVQNLQNEVMALSKESIDPNRFWNNKSDGQKAMGVIAGALFGFTGQGMQWLSRLDSLVQQDIQAQAADLNRRRGLLQDASGLQENLVAMAEKQGLRGQAAYNAAVVTAKERLADQILENSMNYAQPELRIKAEQTALAVRQDAMKERSMLQRQSTLDAQDARLKQAQINHLNAQTFAASVKAAGGGKELQDMKPGQQERLSEMMNLGDSIGNMAKQYREQAGGKLSAVSQFAPLGATAAAQWKQSSAKMHAQSIGKPLEGGKMTDADFPRYLEGFIPSASETSGAAENKIRNLTKYATDKYRNEISTLNAAQVRYLGLPSPEQYEKMLLQKAGIAGDAPAYATPR